MESSLLGLILDSTLVIHGERQGFTVSRLLEQLRLVHGDLAMALSVVTIAELAHGVERAKDEPRRLRRQAFVDEPIRDVPTYPVTIEISRNAGSIGGSLAARGVTVAFEDLLIAATALQLRFGVVTSNVRHFQVVPGLVVVPS